MIRKRGISLIVLVITIVVIIILAASVILNLGENNPIEDARKAKIIQSLDTFKSDLGVQTANKLLKDTNLEVYDIDSKDEDGLRIVDLVPSIKGTEYENQLEVEDGKLILRDDSTLPEKTKSIIREFLSEVQKPKDIIITREMIEKTPSEYIGKSVEYSGYSENTNTIDWRLFGIDKDGNIMLKANDYIDLTYKEPSYPASIVRGRNQYTISAATNKVDLINYIGNKENFNEYAVSGKTTARGAMTIEEFVNGYNLVSDIKIECKYLTTGEEYPNNNSKTAKDDGYLVKIGTSYFIESVRVKTQTYNEMKLCNSDTLKASEYVLASSSCANNTKGEVIVVTYSGLVGRYGAGYEYNGLCPVVSLTSSNLVQKANGSLVIE